MLTRANIYNCSSKKFAMFNEKLQLLLLIFQINILTEKEWDGFKQKLLELVLWNKYAPLKEQGYNGFPQTNIIPFKFYRINYRPLAIMVACNKRNKDSAFDIMDRFKCSREIMTARRNGLLQLMLSNLSIDICLK